MPDGEGSLEAIQDIRPSSLLHFLLRTLDESKRTQPPRIKGEGRANLVNRFPRRITSGVTWILGGEQEKMQQFAAMMN